ncbi:hypothetical protein C8F01DRAFT_108597 [Mycena amicta]|nr:hypothetical protein C8F01DRAFT_108597 [Mycena amicta]
MTRSLLAHLRPRVTRTSTLKPYPKRLGRSVGMPYPISHINSEGVQSCLPQPFLRQFGPDSFVLSAQQYSRIARTSSFKPHLKPPRRSFSLPCAGHPDNLKRVERHVQHAQHAVCSRRLAPMAHLARIPRARSFQMTSNDLFATSGLHSRHQVRFRPALSAVLLSLLLTCTALYFLSLLHPPFRSCELFPT